MHAVPNSLRARIGIDCQIAVFVDASRLDKTVVSE